ncbi:MAG: WYL domain-containing protein [Proteobacteria bacterium]|nr:WYL domain-containing protein [Pseudomonadota bacterium]
MRASRLLAILIMLQLRARTTAQALADEFEVSVRTIYRDIDAISAAGVPVYGDAGPGGGYALLDGFRTRLTGLTSGEAEAIPVIGLPELAEALGFGMAAAATRAKFLAALPETIRRDALGAGARFHFDPADWYQGQAAPRHLPALVRAVLDGRQVRFRYRSWTAERDHEVSPLGIVAKAGKYYLVGARRDRQMIFRVAAIEAFTVLETAATVPPDFDLRERWKAMSARFECDLRSRSALIRVTAEGARLLAELGDYAVDALAAAVPEENRRRRLTLPIESDEVTARALVALGAEIDILEPASLRAAVHALALQAAGASKP